MVRSAWLRRAGPGIVALGAVGMLTSTTLGARDRPWSPLDCAGDDPLGEISARAARAMSLGGAGDAPWFRLDPILDSTGTLAGQRLGIGRADWGDERTMELPSEPFAAGPFGAIVLVGTDDGAASRLFALDVVAGCARPIDTSADVIRRATISPDGGAVVEFRVDRESRADLGIWRKHLDRDDQASQVIPAIGADARFGQTWSTEFLWNVDGYELAIQSCGEAACRTRVVAPGTDELRQVDEPDLGPAIGLADGRLVSYLACHGLPCPVVAIDLSTGARRTLAPDAGPAVVIATDAGARLVHEGVVGARTALRTVRLDGTDSHDTGTLPAGLSLHVDAARSAAGLAAPPGWVLLAPDGRMPIHPATSAAAAPLFRHVLDGRTVAVDEVTR
jgi:hypothetical protein